MRVPTGSLKGITSPGLMVAAWSPTFKSREAAVSFLRLNLIFLSPWKYACVGAWMLLTAAWLAGTAAKKMAARRVAQAIRIFIMYLLGNRRTGMGSVIT